MQVIPDNLNSRQTSTDMVGRKNQSQRVEPMRFGKSVGMLPSLYGQSQPLKLDPIVEQTNMLIAELELKDVRGKDRQRGEDMNHVLVRPSQYSTTQRTDEGTP